MIKDIATMDKQEIVDTINKSMVEHEVRYSSAKQKSEELNASKSYQEMENLFQRISNEGEVVKLLELRLYVHSGTIHELEEKINDVMLELTSHGLRGQVFINETKWEWESMFLPYDKQIILPNGREGTGMPAQTLASSLPYHFSDLRDPNGSHLGMSFTDGSVLFDLFHRDKKRRFYNGVVVGKMGAGKSTLLKKVSNG